MKRKLRSSLAVISITAIMLTTLSGCGSTDLAKASEMMTTRASMNIAQLEKIRDAGLISQDFFELYSKAIEDSLNSVAGMLTDADNIKKVNGAEVRYHGATSSKHDNNSLKQATDANSAIDLMTSSKTGAADLMKEMNYEVWVLNPDKVSEINNASGGGAGKSGIDVLQEYITTAQNSGDYAKVREYFVPSGYSLFGNDANDPYDEETGLFQITKQVDSPSSFDSSHSGINQMGYNMVLETTEEFRYNHTHATNEDGTKNQNYCSEAAGDDNVYYYAQIKLIEFNPETVNRIAGAGNASNGRYVVAKPEDGTKPVALLMEYPVDMASLATMASDKSWEIEQGASELTYNLLTGGFRYKPEGEKESLAIDWGANNDVLYTSKSVKLTNKVDKQALGETYFESAGDAHASSPGLVKFFLTDYLELEYMPGVVQGQNVVALGRMLRIERTKGKEGDAIGYFVGKDGEAIMAYENVDNKTTDGRIKAYATDLAWAAKLEEGQVYKLGESKPAAPGADPNDPNYVGPTPGGDPNNPQVDPNAPVTGNGTLSLPRNTSSPIFPVAGFFSNAKYAGLIANKTDATSTGTATGGEQLVSPPPMYGLVLECDPFATSLYSGWITSDSSSGGLEWWEGFLNKGKFNYAIDKSALEEFLMGTYSTELRKNGVIILDLETIGRIQDQYVKEDQIHSVTMFRSVFALLGIILGAYGLLLMAAWAIDINLVGGPKLLTLITFGRWIAVANAEDIPYASTEQQHYMSFGNVLWTAVGMIAIGAVLGLLDVLEIVNWFVQVLGKFAEVIGSIFTR